MTWSSSWTPDHRPPPIILIAELKELGISRLDFILLTHVHLDHGGCTAAILAGGPKPGWSATPRAAPTWWIRPVCGRGPARSWGERPRSTANRRRCPSRPWPNSTNSPPRGIETIHTPGHAAHHVAFRHGGHLFLGECAGTFSDLGRDPAGDEFYLRPATPPRFIHEVARASLNRLLALDPVPNRLLFAHHGEFTGDTRFLLTAARDQLDLWVKTVAETLALQRGLPHSEQPADEDGLMDLLAARLAQVDGLFRPRR